MTPREPLDDDRPEDVELRTRFDALVAGFFDDDDPTVLPERPDLRRTPPVARRVLTVRVDLKHSRPPIWRRAEVRSDLSLEDLHTVLQVLFGWSGAHLFRFAAGGHPFGDEAQIFLCPFEVEDGETDGIPASDVTVGELLQDAGDRLEYAYDYGDGWHLVLKVERAAAAYEDTPPARATGGRRAAPPEDCGGITDGDGLAEILPDPAAFNLAGIREQLEAVAQPLDLDAMFHPAVQEIRALLRGTLLEHWLVARMVHFARAPEPPEPHERAACLHAVQWFLDRAADDGIPLTQAGWLKPDVVVEASHVVPRQETWYGKNNRENLAADVADFRAALQSMKLLRRYKGALRLTKVGVAVQRDVDALWRTLVANLVPAAPGFERMATALLLLEIANTPPGLPVDLDNVADAMTALGWHEGDGPVRYYTIRTLPANIILANLTTDNADDDRNFWRTTTYSPVAWALAVTVLSGEAA